MEIGGYHFFNNPKNAADRRKAGAFHVVNTLIRNLQRGEVKLPMGPGQAPQIFTMKELGIDYVVLARDPTFRDNFPIPNPNYTPPVGPVAGGVFSGSDVASGSGYPGSGVVQPKEDPENPAFFLVRRYDFVVQFVWIETPLSVRLAKRLAEAKEAEEKAAAASAAPAEGGSCAGRTPAPGAPAPGAPAPGAPAPGAPAPGVPAPGAPAPGVPAPGVPAPGAPAPAIPVPGDPASEAPAAPLPIAPGAPQAPTAAPTPAPATAAPGAATGTPAAPTVPPPGAPAPTVPPGIPAIPDVPM